MNGKRVVVIMPVYNEARHLPRVLESLSAQEFDRRRLFFVAVDGGSTDESATILRQWLSAAGIRGCVASNPRRKIPISLNVGLEHATDDDVIVRLDAHTLYGPRYLADAVAALETAPSDVACVGGPQRPIPATRFSQRLVEALYTNPMGLGGADFRFGSDVREVDHVYLGVWRPGILSHAGGFNEELEANEDGEMSARIRALGYRILRVPLPCRFIINRGVWGSIKQWNRYGYWRCKMLLSNPGDLRRRHLITPIAAVSAVALACSPLRLLLVPLFGVYSLLVYRGRANGESPAVTLATTLYFPALQFAFAAGMLAALVTGRGSVRRALSPVRSGGVD